MGNGLLVASASVWEWPSPWMDFGRNRGRQALRHHTGEVGVEVDHILEDFAVCWLESHLLSSTG